MKLDNCHDTQFQNDCMACVNQDCVYLAQPIGPQYKNATCEFLPIRTEELGWRILILKSNETKCDNYIPSVENTWMYGKEVKILSVLNVEYI